MDVSNFSEQYSSLADDEVLRLWAERDTLVPEAALAIESELHTRGLKKENAVRVKRRLDAVAARKGPLAEKVAAAKYKRNMRHFTGWEEPEFYSPYGSRDPRTMFAYIRHKYAVWKVFRDRTGCWPVLSISFHFASWVAIVVLGGAAIVWTSGQKWRGLWSDIAAIVCVLALFWIRDLGARQVRKLDWKRCSK